MNRQADAKHWRGLPEIYNPIHCSKHFLSGLMQMRGYWNPALQPREKWPLYSKWWRKEQMPLAAYLKWNFQFKCQNYLRYLHSNIFEKGYFYSLLILQQNSIGLRWFFVHTVKSPDKEHLLYPRIYNAGVPLEFRIFRLCTVHNGHFWPILSKDNLLWTKSC